MLIGLSKKSLLKKLKDALYEAEDILDLIDYHRIEKEVGKAESSTWLQWCWQRLCDSTRETSARLLQLAKQGLCWLSGYLHIAGDRSAPLLQWVHERLCWFRRYLHIAGDRSAPLLQWVHERLCWLWLWACNAGHKTARLLQGLCWTGSGEVLPVVSTPSPSLVQRMSLCCRSFDFKNCCSCIFNWLTKAIEGARYYRDWSFDELGFTRYRQGVVMESNCIIMGPLYILLKKNKKKVEKLVDEAQKICTFDKKVQETIDQANQQRRNELGTPTADVTTGDRQKTTSYPVGKITGRDEICQDIRTMLHASKSDVVGIYGIAGSGKTTLAQYVCNAMKEEEKEKEKEKKERHFHLFMWIDVTQKFSVHGIFSEMLEAASDKKAEYTNLDVLQTKLKNELSGKRFLLVLDDIWCNKDAHKQNLEQLIFPLQVGMEGSKILATSRNKDAFADLSPDLTCNSVPIPDLNDDDFYKMFMHYALGRSGLDDSERRKLEDIGAEIVKKLKRLPLVARTVGRRLYKNQDVTFWRSAQVRDLLNETTGALWWSYQQFDEHVMRCFTYCSIFPRRLHFRRDKLVQLWMAQGFIKTYDAAQDPYDVGQNYFDELLAASFLQLVERRVEHGCEVDDFTVHDLLRDLAEDAAGGDCFRIEEGITEEVPPDVRHLFVGSCDIKMLFFKKEDNPRPPHRAMHTAINIKMLIEKISELQNLRTLIIDFDIDFEASTSSRYKKVFERMFRRLKKLRVLVLRFSADDGGCTFSLPACIGLLKHLRYFVFRVEGRVKLILPNSITDLFHIQLLDIDCLDVVFSGGNNISRLVNLRSVSKKQGYELRQVKDLSKLEGELSITGLENVQSKEESSEASLAHKERLRELVLAWGDTSCSPEVEAEVLEGLCPPKYLEILKIRGYHGLTYPNWMVGQQNDGPKDLRNLWLDGCIRLEPAPELFKVFVHLRWFRLWYSNWHALPDNMKQLTSLQFLDIRCCLNIRSLPELPSSLERFHLRCCNLEFMRSCKTIGHVNWQKIQHIPYKSIYMGSVEYTCPLVLVLDEAP